MKITKPVFHVCIGGFLTVITVTAMLMGENTIAGTALGALGGYVLKNGVFNNREDS
jgi:hypothetical protein